MFSQLVEVPLYSIKENDIIYDGNSLEIVIDIICEFEKDINIRTIDAKGYKLAIEMGGLYKAYEVRDYYDTIYKLVEIIEEDIVALLSIKKKIDKKEKRNYLPSVEDILGTPEEYNKSLLQEEEEREIIYGKHYVDIEQSSFALSCLLSEEEQKRTGGLYKNKTIIELIKKHFKTYTAKELIDSKTEAVDLFNEPQVFQKNITYFDLEDYIKINSFADPINNEDKIISMNDITNFFEQLS